MYTYINIYSYSCLYVYVYMKTERGAPALPHVGAGVEGREQAGEPEAGEVLLLGGVLLLLVVVVVG